MVPLCAIFLTVTIGEKSWQVLQILNGNHWFLAEEKGQLGKKNSLLIIHHTLWFRLMKHMTELMTCYPMHKYSQAGFLMNSFRILEDGRTQAYMQESLTFQSGPPIQNGDEPYFLTVKNRMIFDYLRSCAASAD